MKNGQQSIDICIAYKTLEYEIALANLPEKKNEFENNLFVKYLRIGREKQFTYIDNYLKKFDDDLDETIRKKIAILLWKLMPSKSVFAQDFCYPFSRTP